MAISSLLPVVHVKIILNIWYCCSFWVHDFHTEFCKDSYQKLLKVYRLMMYSHKASLWSISL